MAHTSVFIQAPDFPKLEGCEMIAGTYAESLAAAKGMGHDSVEIILGDPDQFDVGSFKALLLEHNLKISVTDSGGIQYLFKAALVSANEQQMEFALEKRRSVSGIATSSVASSKWA